MPERSKGLDSSSSIFGFASSNLVGCRHFFLCSHLLLHFFYALICLKENCFINQTIFSPRLNDLARRKKGIPFTRRGRGVKYNHREVPDIKEVKEFLEW